MFILFINRNSLQLDTYANLISFLVNFRVLEELSEGKLKGSFGI